MDITTQQKLSAYTEIVNWHWKRSQEIYRVEDAGPEYSCNQAAREILRAWMDEKLSLAGITEEIQDLYEVIQEGQQDARATAWEDSQR